MTAFTVSDDATGGGGGLSANAMALGADTNLIFTLEPTYQTASAQAFKQAGLLTISKRMKLNKAAAALEARVASSALPSQEIVGNLRLQRGSQVAAQFNFSIPPTGQIPSPTGSVALQKDTGSAIGKDRTKRWRFAAVRSDASGSTPVGAMSNEIWLGDGTTVITPTYELTVDDNPANNQMGGSAGLTMTVVPYDKLADKECAPIDIPLSWNMGPFSMESAFSPSVSNASGNLPAGTVVQVQKVITFSDDSMITEGPMIGFTIDGSGGCSFNGGAWGGYLQAGNTSVYARAGILYKLSTHSTWTFIQGNFNQIVANTFPEGGYSLPGSSRTFSSIAYATVKLGMSIPILGANFSQRFDLKVFAGGSQVLGTGRSVIGSDNWPYPFYWQANSGNTGFDQTPYFLIGSTYNNEHTNYAARAPRGDQYYIDGEKVGFDVSIPNRFGVTGVKIYASVASANPTTGAATSAFGNWNLVYDGPQTNVFRWLGNILSTSVTFPASNTTANYAIMSGVVNWDASGADDIIVEPGDQLIASCSAGQFSSSVTPVMLQLSMPVEFIS